MDYILEHFDQKTRRNEHYTVKDRRLRGFNSLLGTASIDAARMYYNQFALAQEGRTPDEKLKVGIISSFAPNPDLEDGNLEEEGFETGPLNMDHRRFLEDAIQDYNQMFGTSFDTSSDGFQNYYKDLSKRLKSREIDLVIVVNMFLTGFDATTLNTLWVDKNLKAHGLIQVFSRTNRILNKVKTYGNIVSFRNLEDATNDAIALFGNKNAQGIVTLKTYGEYYQDYADKVNDLLRDYPLGSQIVGEEAQKEFIALFGAILRLQNILTSFDEFAGSQLLTDRQGQDYRSLYLDLWGEFRHDTDAEKEHINDDVVFEIELIKQVEINVDYILMLVQNIGNSTGMGKIKKSESKLVARWTPAPPCVPRRTLLRTLWTPSAWTETLTMSGAPTLRGAKELSSVKSLLLKD